MFNYQNYGLIEELPPTGGAPALVTGWQPGATERLSRQPRIFEQGPALVLTPATLPPKIAGMAWFEPPDQPVYGRKAFSERSSQIPFRVIPQRADGWLRQPEDLAPVKPKYVDQRIAVALTPATLPVPISGLGWFRRWDEVPRKPAPIDVPSAVQKPLAAVPVSGMAWFAPLDELPRPAPKPHWGPALALTPATLPVAVSGVAWFVRWQDLPVRKAPLDQPIQVQLQTAGALAVPPNGWFVQAQELLRKAFTPDTAAPFVGSPAPFAGLGWYLRWQELPPVRAFAAERSSFVPPPIASAIAGLGWHLRGQELSAARASPNERPSFVSPPVAPATAALGWQRLDDVLPVIRRQQRDIGAGVALTPATLPARISGMGWFAPLDELPRKWKPLLDLPAWSAQVITIPVFPFVLGRVLVNGHYRVRLLSNSGVRLRTLSNNKTRD